MEMQNFKRKATIMTIPKESIADKLRVGGDLRSIGQVNDIIENIDNQAKFDELFKCLFHKELLSKLRYF
jgi:hypothetical protein